jgi:hypothetical protein
MVSSQIPVVLSYASVRAYLPAPKTIPHPPT